MNSSIKLISDSKQFEKRAFPFLKGLLAPVTKLRGGAKILTGRAQQGISAAKNITQPATAVRQLPAFQQGTKNVAEGQAMREGAALNRIWAPGVPLAERAGRVIGTAGLGVPIASAPFTAAQYIGALNTDPAAAQQAAQAAAQQRVKDRIDQYGAGSVDQVIQALDTPEEYTKNLVMPEAKSLIKGVNAGAYKGPPVTDYLKSILFPISFGQAPSASQVIRQQARSQFLNKVPEDVIPPQLKSGHEKKAYNLLKSLAKGYTIGRNVTRAIPKPLPTVPLNPNQTLIGEAANKGFESVGYNLGRVSGGLITEPIKTTGKIISKGVVKPLSTAAVAASIPAGLKRMYDSGQADVMKQVKQDAAGMADLAWKNEFERPSSLSSGVFRFMSGFTPNVAKFLMPSFDLKQKQE